MISVIIPAYNASRIIGDCIAALKGQTFRDFETIVVDDGSTDGTAEAARKTGAKVIIQKHAGPAVARNLGVKECKGSIVVFTDADCIPDPKWLENMLKPFADQTVAGAAGTYKTKNSESLTARFTGYEIELRHERMKKFERIDFIGTYSAAYRKDIFLKFGGFDENFRAASGEDSELSFKIAKAGHKLVFASDAFVWHRHPNSVGKYLKQKFNRGYWRVALYKKHPEKMKGESYTPPSLLVETALTGISIPLAAAAFAFPLSAYAAAACLLAVAVININLFLFMFRKELTAVLFSVPMVFLRNLAYGFGILKGLIDMAMKNG
jgi:glycosyltransferase involved in cell wall biosynthesis